MYSILSLNVYAQSSSNFVMSRFVFCFHAVVVTIKKFQIQFNHLTQMESLALAPANQAL